MIAIRDQGILRSETYSTASAEIFELLQAGDKHWDLTVSNIFFQARQLAARAVSENSESSLVVSALLYRPCQMLACGSFQAGDWTGDSLHETGTYDWLTKYFGEEVAEVIRLQTAAKRFLSTVIPKYFSRLDIGSQRSIYSEGGLMTMAERISFGKNRFHQHAMKLAGWVDRGVDRYLDLPEMDFFLPFVNLGLVPLWANESQRD